MSKDYLVSVIIPVYNGERFLKEAILSAINQTYKHTEIIVVDDGSTDGSADIAKSFEEVIYIYQDNGGVASARNTALEIIKGDFIAFLDADDYYAENKLERQVAHLLSNKSIGYSLAHHDNFIEPGYELSPDIQNYYMNREVVSISSMLVNKDVVDKVGKFNTTYKVGSDYEWITRMSDLNIKRDILPEIMLYRRVHDSNLTLASQKDSASLRLRIIKESLDRKRSKNNKL